VKIKPEEMAEAEAKDHEEICPDEDANNYSEIYIAGLIGIIITASVTILIMIFL